MATDDITDPKERTLDNSEPNEQGVKEPVQSPPSEEDNGAEGVKETPSQEENVELTPEKREELRQKLRASKEEALRWKTKAEQLAQQVTVQEPDVPYQVTPADVATFKALARAAGLVDKSEIQRRDEESYMQGKQAQLDKFLADHPEYSKPGDKESDELWQEFTQQVAMYREPASAEDWGKVLNKAHRDLFKDNSFEKGQAYGMAKSKVRADIGGGASGTSSPKKKISPAQQQLEQELRQLRPHWYK